MNEREREPVARTPDEERALAALRRAGMPEIPHEVRERVRQAFLTGRRPEDGPPAPLPIARSTPGRGWRRFAWVAAAAAIALVVGSGLQPAGNWRVTDAIAPEGIEVPSREGAGASTPLARVGAGEIRVGSASELELELAGGGRSPDSGARDTVGHAGGRVRLRLRMLAGTEASLPTAPARWLGRDRTLEVRSGEAFGVTFGPLGFKLRLSTPEAEAVLTGTSFAVIRSGEETCFCLYRGHLDITQRNGRRPIELPLEHRVVVYGDGRPPRIEPITDRERMKLSMMEAARPDR